MPRAREYKNNAERQAAYRARHPELQLPRQGHLAALARTLHGELREAQHAGRSPWPQELLGKNVEETLRHLIHYLRACTQADAARSDKKGDEQRR
jgi:hypothetical protein